MTYYLYHVPGKKIGVTCNLKHRVEKQQGYKEGEYNVILQTDDISLVSEAEVSLQKAYGYRVDRQLYKDLYKNNFKELNNMNINITEQTTTFPCPPNKLKGRLMDNIGMTWDTDHGKFKITIGSIRWIMSNLKKSMYNDQRSYVYNKAFARYYDNHNAYEDMLGGNLADAHMREKYPENGEDQYDGKTLAGGMSEQKVPECCDENTPCECMSSSQFDLIRDWAYERGLYENGDPKTQALKLVEEVGEIARAVLKDDIDEVIDGIGDAVVVLTNLAELHDVSIEECIASAYGVISKRTGKMVNGTFVKD